MTGNTLTRSGQFDALEKARPDELIFSLLERDPMAPPTIIHWVDLRRKMAIDTITDPEKLRAELMQCTEAEFIAHEMIARQQGQDAEAVAKNTSYSGIVIEAQPIDDMMANMRKMLSEADYFVHEVLDLMRTIYEHNQPAALDWAHATKINDAARTIHEIAMELSPHRARLMAESELPLDDTTHPHDGLAKGEK